MLIDSHCHLDFPELLGDIDGVLRRAREAGVGEMLTICTRLDRFAAVHELAIAHESMWCSVGVHPHEANEASTELTTALVKAAREPKVVAIGETGLDYYHENSARDTQRETFRHHIDAARETGLPVVIHSRDADDDMAELLSENMKRGTFHGVIHCFTSSQRLAETALNLGLYISFSGIVTFKNATAIRDVARAVPVNRLLIETDSPYLAPVPHRGKPNEPAFIADTAAFMGDLLGISLDALAALTTQNFRDLFSKAQRH